MRSARGTARRSPLPRRILRPRSMSRTLAPRLRIHRPRPDRPARAPATVRSTRGRDGRPRLGGRCGQEPRTARRYYQRPFPRRAGSPVLPSSRLSSSAPRQDRCARRRPRDAREGPSGTRLQLPPFVRAGVAAWRSTAVPRGRWDSGRRFARRGQALRRFVLTVLAVRRGSDPTTVAGRPGTGRAPRRRARACESCLWEQYVVSCAQQETSQRRCGDILARKLQCEASLSRSGPERRDPTSGVGTKSHGLPPKSKHVGRPAGHA